MSYRSIKLVLGEASLERKCRFLFGACLLLLITAAFWWYGSQTEKLVYLPNRVMGRLLVNQSMLTRHWQAFETDKTAEEGTTDYTALVQNIIDNVSKEKYRADFVRPTDTERLGRFERDLVVRFLSKPPVIPVRTPQGAPSLPKPEAATDPATQANPPPAQPDLSAGGRSSPAEAAMPDFDEEQYAEQFVSDTDEYVYYQPVFAEDSSCVICHNALRWGTFESPRGGLAQQPLNEGDMMAIAKITIPNARTKKAMDGNRAILLSTAIVAVFLAMVASWVIVRYVIVKPLRHLRNVSDAISRGNLSLRAEIHTGDEFEALAVAFNRMLRHLVAAQEELRQVNADLDAKVDELAQVNMRLYEMNLIKSDFLATMSHELRTPLNSILGFSEVLGSIDSLQDKQKRYVQNIQTSGRLLLEMINDVLDLAKMESGKMDTRLTNFSLEQIVAAQCDMARPLAEKKNIDLEVQVQADLPPMHQDQARVQQILNNLLSNAIKFTPEGGRIVVSARRDEENHLLMQVTDTGVGIAPEDQQCIFEKFRQGRTGVPTGDAMTREYSGTGLGLSIVRELCRLLGGNVSVQSELGKGSTFTFRLPWELQEQRRLDSALVEGFEEFTRPRFELPRDLRPDVPDSPGPGTAQPAGGSQK